jgi:hypothetical protein
MSITLVDGPDRSLKVDAWNWGVLISTIEQARPALFQDVELRRMRSGGAELPAGAVELLRRHLEASVLPRIGPGERMLHDLSVTDEPDDGTFHRDQLERNYSLQREVLVTVIDFLSSARGPVTLR